jgi:predicted phage terminase large subunit-like protein
LACDPDIRRLLIIAPPESAKTTWMSVILPLWWIGNNPLSTNAIISITAHQAFDRLRSVKETIQASPTYGQIFPSIKPNNSRGWKQNQINVWDEQVGSLAAWSDRLARDGHPQDATMFAAGITSNTIIGKRFSGLTIVDDPQDYANTRSESGRRNVIRWFKQNLLSRITTTGKVVVIMTRWHREDLAGALMDTPGWVTTELPAISANGESYWPSQWPMERLKDTRRELGSAIFRAMYQGDPTGLAGQVFQANWFNRIDGNLPHFRQVVMFWDLAISTKETSDYTVGLTCGITENNELYILNVRRGHWTFHEQIQRVTAACSECRALYGRLDAVGVEAVQYQLAAVQELIRTTREPILPVRPDKDKVARAQGVAVRAEAGAVFVDHHAAWFGDFIDELVDFPNGAHDDQVDGLSGCWALLTRHRPVRANRNPFYGKREKKSWPKAR